MLVDAFKEYLKIQCESIDYKFRESVFDNSFIFETDLIIIYVYPEEIIVDDDKGRTVYNWEDPNLLANIQQRMNKYTKLPIADLFNLKVGDKFIVYWAKDDDEQYLMLNYAVQTIISNDGNTIFTDDHYDWDKDSAYPKDDPDTYEINTSRGMARFYKYEPENIKTEVKKPKTVWVYHDNDHGDIAVFTTEAKAQKHAFKKWPNCETIEDMDYVSIKECVIK